MAACLTVQGNPEPSAVFSLLHVIPQLSFGAFGFMYRGLEPSRLVFGGLEAQGQKVGRTYGHIPSLLDVL